MTVIGTLSLQKLDGVEIAPRVYVIGEPTPIPGTDRLCALADCRGNLVLIELRLRFENETARTATLRPPLHG